MRISLALALLVTLAGGALAAPAYDVSGVVIHQCSCPYACPCMFENGPEDCALAAIYHMDRGAYDGVSVAGLSMISIDGAVNAHSPDRPPSPVLGRGAGGEGRQAGGEGASGVVYLDAAATPAQSRALLALLQAHGEWPGAARPVKAVPIQFTKTDTGYETVVPGLFRGRTELAQSRKRTRIAVDGVGFPEGPRWTVGRSVVNDLHDPALGLRWHLPNTNGSWSLWRWTAGQNRTAEENAPIGRPTH